MKVNLNEKDYLRLVETDREGVAGGLVVWYDIIHVREYGTMSGAVGEVEVLFARGAAPRARVSLEGFPDGIAEQVEEVVCGHSVLR